MMIKYFAVALLEPVEQIPVAGFIVVVVVAAFVVVVLPVPSLFPDAAVELIQRRPRASEVSAAFLRIRFVAMRFSAVSTETIQNIVTIKWTSTDIMTMTIICIDSNNDKVNDKGNDNERQGKSEDNLI